MGVAMGAVMGVVMEVAMGIEMAFVRGERARRRRPPAHSEIAQQRLSARFPARAVSQCRDHGAPSHPRSGRQRHRLDVGWLHHGFHKHRLPGGSLGIERYTRPDRPWTAAWWKFDLPPGFDRYTHRPLQEVCALQWLSANEHILQWVERNRADIHYVQTSTARLSIDLDGEMARLFAELELDPDAGLLRAVARNRRTMLSYGVSDDARSKLRRCAAAATANARVCAVLDAFADLGGGPSLEVTQAEAWMGAR